jgi:hypothetical protein
MYSAVGRQARRLEPAEAAEDDEEKEDTQSPSVALHVSSEEDTAPLMAGLTPLHTYPRRKRRHKRPKRPSAESDQQQQQTKEQPLVFTNVRPFWFRCVDAFYNVLQILTATLFARSVSSVLTVGINGSDATYLSLYLSIGLIIVYYIMTVWIDGKREYYQYLGTKRDVKVIDDENKQKNEEGSGALGVVSEMRRVSREAAGDAERFQLPIRTIQSGIVTSGYHHRRNSVASSTALGNLV